MIGLDIGSKYIKMCEIEKTDDKYNIIFAALCQNPSNNEKDDVMLIDKLKSIVKDNSLQSNAAACSVGNAQILMRNFLLPALAHDELKSAVKLEAEQSIFSNLSSMDTDFQILDTIGTDKLSVLFVAAPKQIIDRQMNIVKDINMDLAVMDIDNLAVTNSFLTFEPEAYQQAVMILNAGHSNTNISIVVDGKLIFVRNVNFGGKHVSLEIEKYCDVSSDKAEYIKEHPELWNETGLNIRTILAKSTPDLLEAIYRSIEYCKGRKMITILDKILLTGGTSYLSGIDDFIKEVMDLEVKKWNPLNFLTIPDNSKKHLGNFFTVAMGLALRK